MENAWNIELQEVSMGYATHVVLENISVTIPGGKITTILGGSGDGKTTMLRHIIGLSRPMSGKILLGGRNIFSLSNKDFRKLRRRMGVLFQDGALLGQLTLAENVGLPLTEHTKLPKEIINEIVNHKLDLVGLSGFADHFPSELSGGMRKRAGLARAMVTDPHILLCDEPTSGLDPINAAQMDELLLDMKKRFAHMTIVAVSHDMSNVRKIADYVIVLRAKRIVYAGCLAGLEESTDAYVRGLLDRKADEENLRSSHTELSERTRQLTQQALDKWLDRS